MGNEAVSTGAVALLPLGAQQQGDAAPNPQHSPEGSRGTVPCSTSLPSSAAQHVHLGDIQSFQAFFFLILFFLFCISFHTEKCVEVSPLVWLKSH